MRGPEPARVAAVLIGAVILSGCGPPVQKRVPYLKQVQASRKEVRGAQIWVRLGGEWPHRDVAGELIAARADSVWVLTDRQLTAIPTRDLRGASIQLSEGVGPEMPPLLRINRPDRWTPSILARHARFPQGIPRELDRTTLAAP